jgi:hypothetical protein
LSALFTDDIHFVPHFHKKMKPATKEELKVYNPIKQFEASVMRTKTKYEIVKETGTDKDTSKLVNQSFSDTLAFWIGKNS